MRKFSRLISGVALAAAAALALAGCSGGGGDSTTADGKTELTLWHGYTEADGKVLQSIVDKFNASQDKYEVKAEAIAWTSISEKLLSSLSAKNGPNIVVQGVDTGLGYANQGAFISQQPYYDNADGTYENTDVFYDQSLQQVTFDGEIYGNPMGITPFSVYYNKALWDAAGLTEADYPTDVDGLIALAKKLTIDADGDGTPEQYGLAFPDQDAGQLSNILHSGGGDFITDGENHLDSPENIATLEKWQSAYQDDKISPTGMNGTDAMELFGSGQAAMIMNGPWEITSAASFGIDVDTFKWPSDWYIGVYNYWYSTSMNDSDAEVAGTYAFYDWWNSHDSQVEWTNSYYPPNRTDVTEDEYAFPIVAKLGSYSADAHYYATGISTSVPDITATTDAMQTQIMQGGDVPSLVKEASEKLDGYVKQG